MRMTEGQGTLTDWVERGMDKLGHKKVKERREPTNWRPQKKAQFRVEKKGDKVRGTHVLEIAEGGTSQDTERNPVSEGRSLSGDRRAKGKS